MTALIVAFVAYCGAFGIGLVPAVGDQSAWADRNVGFAVLDDEGERGR
jgi:cytochrome c5